MLAKALSAWAIGALIPLVQAQKKSTYDFEAYPGDHKKWIPKKGCNLLIQAPADSKPVSQNNQSFVQCVHKLTRMTSSTTLAVGRQGVGLRTKM
jgi:hypothetical protein